MMEDLDKKAYPPNNYGINQNHPKHSGENSSHLQNVGKHYANDDEDEDDLEEDEGAEIGEEEEEEDDVDDDEDEDGSGVQRIGKDGYELVNDNDGDDLDDDIGDMEKHPKKRKLKTLLSNYEFAPRAPAPSALASSSFSKPAHGGRNPLTDWTENETFILLNAWGERYLKQGRKSLRSEEWQEVAEKVSQESEIERTDTQCRNRLDTLKKKYKKEMMKPASKWVYFKQMDELLSSTPQQAGLSCGVDAGEFIFMDPKVYLNSSNGLDEMRDSPENSESGEGEEDDAEGISLKGDSFKILADSIYKFSEIYQKIEKSKRQQMVELDRMRKEFQRELELQKREIFERAQVEIQKIREGEYDDNEVSGENGSG